jgi:hypothetical protein
MAATLRGRPRSSCVAAMAPFPPWLLVLDLLCSTTGSSDPLQDCAAPTIVAGHWQLLLSPYGAPAPKGGQRAPDPGRGGRGGTRSTR